MRYEYLLQKRSEIAARMAAEKAKREKEAQERLRLEKEAETAKREREAKVSQALLGFANFITGSSS
jgi:hypothetical protein